MSDYEEAIARQQLDFAQKFVRSLTYLAATRPHDPMVSMEAAVLEALEDARLELKEA